MQDGNVSPVKAFFRNKWVRTIIILDIFVVIAIAAIYFYDSSKNAIISFKVAPIDATITVNGNSDSYHNGSFRIRPGTYEIIISHADLDTKTFTIELEAESSTAVVTFLSKDGNFDFYRLRRNNSSYLTLAEIASPDDNQTTDNDISAEAFISDLQRNYELYSTQLPLTYSEYDEDSLGRSILSKYITIREGHNCDITLCLEATLFNRNDGKQVEEMLKEAGFNVEDFEIEYKTS